MSNEILAPAIDIGRAAKIDRDLGAMRFLAFFNYGHASNHGSEDDETLYSIGIGMRYNLGTYVSARFDYGWQLKDIDTAGEDSARAHAGIVAAF